MKVYIRHTDEADAVYLTELESFTEVPTILSFLKVTGVHINDAEFGERDEFDVRIVVDETEAYLEVIVG